MLTRRLMLAASLVPVCTRVLPAADPDPTRVFPDGQKSTDPRLGKPKTLNDYFPFTPPATLKEWEVRKQHLREQVLVANGLWPLPEKEPLKPTIRGAVERDGYTVKKVFFASTAGHSVTGNLYEPIGRYEHKRPGVLFAHGHWKDGRFHDAGEAAAAKSVKTGAESDPARGRFFMQAIPVQLARMGFVVFQYDMVGYADSTAIPHIAKSGVPHPEGFADAQGELRLQSLMGLQTWNSVRALDFLESLPNVDPKKIGITGASGGGTQTFLLAAIDDRVAAAFPAVMVSTAMQGGCVCENCSLLRVGTGNIELAALFAPKPMAMSAADDWTKDLMTKGFPDLQKTWKLYGAEDKVAAKAWLEFPHNYNQPAREFMYSWFDKHLNGGKGGPVAEKPFEPIPPKELSVFDAEHPRPKDELGAAEVRQRMTAASEAQMAKLLPNDAGQLKKFRAVVGPALAAVVGDAELPVHVAPVGNSRHADLDGVTVQPANLSREHSTEQTPVAAVSGPKSSHDFLVVWVHPNGKASLFEKGKLHPAAKSLTDAGFTVLAPDPFGVGESAADKWGVNPVYAGFTYGYNRAPLANRVRDVLTTLGFAAGGNPKALALVGWGAAGPVAVLAAALAGKAVAKVAADLNGFRFDDVTKTDDPMMLPGAVKYGGLGSFLALCAPTRVLVHNNKGTGIGRTAKAAYKAAGTPDALTVAGDKLDDAKVVEWLVK
jgi:dienelactone hydrolase